MVTAWAVHDNGPVARCYPDAVAVAQEIPDRPRAFLTQAIDSLHAPSGAVLLAGSCVDAMLKEKQLVSGSLYSRIEQAVTAGLLTPDMSKWAHQVRLDANDQRHADQSAALPTEVDAQLCISFAEALGEILFVLPARVARGLQASTASPAPSP